MKVLIDHNEPFLLAHGGMQVLVDRTSKALREEGCEVEYLRWWDESQSADLIHFFGRPNPSQITFAHAKGIRYVFTELLTSQGSRARLNLHLQGLVNRVLRAFLPMSFQIPLRWESYRLADGVIAYTEWEAWIIRKLFPVRSSCLHVVPTGADAVYFAPFQPTMGENGQLICVATITERKRVVELAEAAVLGRVPVVFVGKPYSDRDPYFLKFVEVVRGSNGLLAHMPPIDDSAELAAVFRKGRGFVLLSTMETQSTAAIAASAVGIPLLLSDLPWARTSFGGGASYVDDFESGRLSAALRSFFENAAGMPRPARPLSWREVAQRLNSIYSSLSPLKK